MAVKDYVNFAYMRRMVEETMLCTAQRLAYTADHDVFGGEVLTYTPAETFACGFKPLLLSEQPSFTGVAINFDAKVRLPHSAYSLLNQRDRLRIETDGRTADYEIIGTINSTPFTVVLEVSQVQ